MGDIADDMFDHEMRQEDRRMALLRSCPFGNYGCPWFINDDGLYECRQCSEVVDI